MNLEELAKVLAANGVDEETAKKIISDLEKSDEDSDDEEEDNPSGDEGNPEEGAPASTEDDKSDDDLPPGEHGDGNGEGDPAEGEPNPTEVPPTEVPPELPPLPPEGAVPPEGTVPPTTEEVPPADAPLPPVGNDPELLARVDEQDKVIDGLTARIASLEEALQKSGILSEDSSFGISNQGVPEGNPATNDSFDDALAEINGRSRKY